MSLIVNSGSCKALLSTSRENSKEQHEKKQKRIEERKKLMQPTFKKYGIRKQKHDGSTLFPHNDEKHLANAGRVSS